MTTPLDALVAALRDTASYNPAAEAPPEAVLWCDLEGEFSQLLPLLRERLPELFTYGEVDQSRRTGPAVWLRAVLANAIRGCPATAGLVPILYLPGVGRETLKGAEDCPALLQPLVWYTVAGTMFGHVNGKDWTMRGFLAADRGQLRLNVADSSATRVALAHAAVRFFTRPVEDLRGKRWDADALNSLVAPDVAADMLEWMDGAFTDAVDPARFAAFANVATKELKFDPRKLSRQDAARRLVTREGKWDAVWARFAGSSGYDGVATVLGMEEPPTLFDHFDNQDAYPKLNAAGETELRKDLAALDGVGLAEARARVLQLVDKHYWRRETVWARRGQAPLAFALEHLAEIARAKALPAHDGDTLAEAYLKNGCRVDFAATRALAVAPRDVDRQAVEAALRAIYLPWLDEGAQSLQELIRIGKVKLAAPEPVGGSVNTVLFVDGMRMDLAQELADLLSRDGLTVSLRWSWSGYPTVTATCKPLVSPVAGLLNGPPTTPDVLPLTPEGKTATKPVLFKLMQAQGWETDNALLSESKLWAETGRFDEEGHALGARLAERLSAGVRDVADKVIQLARAGRSIRIVTDHGWLLMPGGLEKAELEVGLVEPQGKRSRCAMVKPSAQTSYLQVPWTWNDQVFVATATGARSFYSGQEYAHGGVSPQECILPILEVSGAAVERSVSIGKAAWEGLRLRIEVKDGADLSVDLRLGTETSGLSVIKGVRVLDDSGKTSFLVSDEHEGKAVTLVVLDDGGAVLAYRALTVGGE